MKMRAKTAQKDLKNALQLANKASLVGYAPNVST